MKKKLLHVIEAAGGGALQYVVDICNHLSSEDWDIEVVFSRRNVTPKDVRALFRLHVTLTEVIMTREISMKSDFQNFKYLHKKFRETKWDLIHLHSSKAGALGRLAAKGIRTPVIYTPHGYSFYQRDIGYLKQKLYFGIEKWLDRINKTHILVSSVNEYTDTSKMMRADKRLRRISNSVHLSYEALRREEEKLVITVGRLTAAKNPQLWLDVIEEACNLEHGLRFVWVGDGEYREYIETQAKERRLPLTITGWMERPDIEAWYRRCSVYVQLSLWEGLPLAVLEAMAAECAIVVSDIPAHRELIRHGANGYIALNRNEAVQAILSLIDSPRTCRQFGHAAREVVEEKYSIRQFSAQIRQYYNSILDGGAKYDRTHSISVGHHTML